MKNKLNSEDFSLEFSIDKRTIVTNEIAKLKENFIEFDKKTIQMLVLYTALCGFLITSLSNSITKCMLFNYGITFMFIIAGMFILLYSYIPKTYQAIKISDLKQQKVTKKNNYVIFNEHIFDAFTKEYDSLLKKCEFKSKILKISFILLISSFMSIFFLKLMEVSIYV